VSANPQVAWQYPFGMAVETTGNFVVADLGYGSIYRLTSAGQFIGPIPLSGNGLMVAPMTVAIAK